MSVEDREILDDVYATPFTEKPLPQRPSSRASSCYTDCRSTSSLPALQRTSSRGSISSRVSVPIMEDLVETMMTSPPRSPARSNMPSFQSAQSFNSIGDAKKQEHNHDEEAAQPRQIKSRGQRLLHLLHSVFTLLVATPVLALLAGMQIYSTQAAKATKSKAFKATYRTSGIPRPRSLHPSRTQTPLLDPEFIISSDEALEVQRARATLTGEKEGFVEYSIWRPIVGNQDLAVDILFLPDSSTSGHLPAVARSYVEEGYRVIVPDFNSVSRVNKEVSITRMVSCIGEIVKDVRRRDCEAGLKRPYDSGYNSVNSSPAPSPQLPTFDHIATAPPIRRQTLDSVSSLSREQVSAFDRRRASFTYGKGTRPSLIPRPSTYRPVFLVGVGLGGLVGLHYAIRSNPFNFGLPPTANKRFSISSAVEQLSLYMPAKPNVRRLSGHRPMSSIGVAPFPEVRGLILLSATVGITPNMLQHQSKNRQSRVQSHLGPISALPPARSSINDIKLLHDSALNVRVPLLMLHGTKDPFTASSTAAGLYDRFGTGEKTLVMYPGLAHINSAPAELQQTIIKESLDWLETAVQRCRTPNPSKQSLRSVHWPEGIKGGSWTPDDQNQKEEQEILSSLSLSNGKFLSNGSLSSYLSANDD